MINLKKVASEYFIGTETINFHKQERGFYQEYIENKRQLSGMLLRSKFVQGLDLTLSKLLPDVISGVAIANALLTWNPSPLMGVAFGEMWRVFSRVPFITYKLASLCDQHQIQNQERDREFTEQIYELCDQDTKGEEWKDN